jgi:hypothetical protein
MIVIREAPRFLTGLRIATGRASPVQRQRPFRRLDPESGFTAELRSPYPIKLGSFCNLAPLST